MSTIVTIAAGDLISNSRSDINTNFSNLNTDKEEASNKDTDTSMAANSDTKYPSQKAVKTYIDTSGGANASETARGIVEEATDAEVTAGTATGGTGAKLIVTPAKLTTRLTATALNPVRRVYLVAGSPATWTKPSGLKYVDVEVIGGGGGGGGANSASAYAGGGGGGGYSRELIAVASLGATETVTTGAGGAAGSSSGGNGGTGGTSSFGSLCSATGGAGGNALGAGNGYEKGGAGGAGSGGDFNATGGTGGTASGATSGLTSGMGGNSIYGGGALPNFSAANGNTGNTYGGGGSGAIGSSATGGVGGAGIVIVTEHYI